MEQTTNIQKMGKELLKKEIEEHLLRAEEDIENGRTVDAREVFKELEKRYGF